MTVYVHYRNCIPLLALWTHIYICFTKMSMSEKLWYRHPDRCWSLGTVSQLQGKRVALVDVLDKDNTVVVPIEDTHPCDQSHLEDADDIARMNNMHEAPLLDLLRRRYKKNIIYTFTGEILISINPYKKIEGLYTLSTDDPKHGRGMFDSFILVNFIVLDFTCNICIRSSR